ncbi:hypothetical protein B0H12DRAFT_1238947 [Mycena haematopus]|nr:hypothetical protein B0H12DRAFT_1238947 [Mycena haematopus]
MSTTTAPATRVCSQIDMPALKARGAPKKFTGKSQDVARFLTHLEKLFVENNVTADVERIESLADYCSRDVVHILEGMKNYSVPNWNLLSTDMLSMFDADKDHQRHRFSDLIRLTEKWRKHQIKSMTEWRKYYRAYTKVSGWLENKGLIQEAEADRYLWQGMCTSLRELVEERLLAKDPTRDMTTPFKRADVIKVVEAKFRRGRFDADIESDDTDSEDSDSSSDESADSSDEDSDTPSKKKGKKSSSKSKKKKSVHKNNRLSSSYSPPPKTAVKTTPPSDEVGDLIKKMSRMNIDDPDYNYLYYQATTLDPHAAKCLRAPILAMKPPPPPPNQFRNNQYAPPAQYGPQVQYAPGAPPAGPNGPVQNARPPPVRPEDRQCFGCGKLGHGVWDCAEINEVVARGELRRGERGALEWPDGRILRRFNQQNETLIDAFKRQRQPPPAGAVANYTYESGPTVRFCNTPEIIDEDVVHPVFVQAATTDSELDKIFAVTRSTDRTNERHAPYPKERPHTRAHIKEAEIPLHPPLPYEPVPKQEPALRNCRFKNPSTRSIIGLISQTTIPLWKTLIPLPKSQNPKRRKISQESVLNMILNTPVTLSAGQILGVSSTVSNALGDALRLRNQPRGSNFIDLFANSKAEESHDSMPCLPVIAGASYVTRDRLKLIRIQVNVNGKIVHAIVDTGSMLNLVSRKAWRSHLPHISMDVTRHINMGDANGGVKELRGFLNEVALITGGAPTTASFWVGDSLPFDMLLGRPWQKGNFVSIEERPDGTYLIFRDAETGNNRFQLHVQEEDDDMDLQSNHVIPMPGSFMTRVIETPSPVPSASEDLDPADSIFGCSDDEETPSTSSGIADVPSGSICTTCQVIMHYGLFQTVSNWNSGAESFSQAANAVLASDHAFNSSINPSRHNIAVHNYFTGFSNLQPGDITVSPGNLFHLLMADPPSFYRMHDNKSLISRDRRRHLQGFLRMHPELVWYAEEVKMSPHTFLTRLSYFIGEHLQENQIASSGASGISNAELTHLHQTGSIDQFDLRRLATNPIAFLGSLPALMQQSLVTEHEKRLVKMLLNQRPYYLPDAISEGISPRTFIIALLCFIRTLPEFTTIPVNSLPPLSGMFNSLGYYHRSGSVISISSSRSLSPEPVYQDSNPLLTPLSTIFDESAVDESMGSKDLELLYPESTPEPAGPENLPTINSSPDDSFEYHVERFCNLVTTHEAARSRAAFIGPLIEQPVEQPVASTAHFAPGLERTRDPRIRIDERRQNTPYRAQSPIYIPKVPYVRAASQPRGLSSPSYVADSSIHLTLIPPSSGTRQTTPRGPRNPTTTYKLRAAVANSRVPVSVIDYHRVKPEPALHENRLSVLWDHPTRAGPDNTDIALQSFQMALDCSYTYSTTRTGDDPRDLRREEARRASRNSLSAADRYYNVERSGRFLPEEIRFLDAQATVDDDMTPSALPPSINAFLALSRSCRVPGYLVHLASDDLLPSDFLDTRRRIWEIISAYRERPIIRRILHPLDTTSFMFRTIPYSPKYNFGRSDPFTVVCAGIRQLITQGIKAVYELLRDQYADVVFVRHYRHELEKRKDFQKANRFPACFFLHPSETPIVPYSHDLKVNQSHYHAFIHPYEHDFLAEASVAFKYSTHAKVRAISALIPQLLGTRFEHHSEMTHLHSAGILGTVGHVDIFADDFEYSPADSEETYYP